MDFFCKVWDIMYTEMCWKQSNKINESSQVYRFILFKSLESSFSSQQGLSPSKCQASVWSSVLSCHNKDLECQILKPSACHSSQVLNRPCYSSQTNQCYSSVLQLYFIQKIAGKSIFEAQRREWEGWGRGERGPWPFGSSFYMFFLLSGPALCKLGQPGELFVLPEVLTPVLGPSFVLFSQAFPFLIFQPLPFWTVSYSNYLTQGTQR